MIDDNVLDEILKNKGVKPVAKTTGNDWYSNLERNKTKVKEKSKLGVSDVVGLNKGLSPGQIAEVGKQYGGTVKEAAKGGIEQTKAGYKESRKAAEEGNLLKMIEGSLKMTAGAAGVAFSPLAPVSKVVEKGVEIVSEPISDIPAVQKFSTSKAGKTTSRVVEDISNINTIAGAVTGGIEMAPKVKAGVQKLSTVPSKIKEVTTTPIETKVTKAFPALKKEVSNLPKKVENVKTALSDIAKNKESLGIVEEGETPRNPKNFVETMEAQKVRMPQIYKEYTAKLSEVDKPKFFENIHNGIFKTINNIDSKLKVENLVDNRRALTKIKNELGSLRDTSPEGIQKYIESINQKVKPVAPGGSLTPEQIQYANLAGELRKVLDDSIEKVGGEGYQELRNVYAAHKQIQSQLLSAVKKEINKTPGFTEKLGNVGLSVEGLNFLLTHDPQALAIGLGVKGVTKWMTWLKSPQRALRDIFKAVENQKTSSSLKPQVMKTNAIIEPKNIIPGIIPSKEPKKQPKTSTKKNSNISELFKTKKAYAEELPKYYIRNNTITENDLEEAKAILFGEISNRDLKKQTLEAQTILNTAFNRMDEYRKKGKEKTLTEVLQTPNQYQAYKGKEYQKYKSGKIEELDKQKLKAINSMIEKVKNGTFQNNVGKSVFYKHLKDDRIRVNNKKLFAK